MVNGRRKGANFERKIAKLFEKHTGLKFRRTPMSGGWTRENPELTGDLICMTEGAKFPFHVECKNTESWNLEAIFKNSCKAFDNWYNQAYKACPVGKHPLIVFSKANSPEYVTFELKLGRPDFIDYEDAAFNHNGNFIMINNRIVLLLSDYIKNINSYLQTK